MLHTRKLPPVVLSIAGSDSGGGAGIQADLKTFEAHGVFGTTAITAITAQNTLGVTAIQPVDLAVVDAQIAAVCQDFPVAAIKIGMLADAAIVRQVAQSLRQHAPGIPVVLDPVMVASSGAILLQPEAIQALIADLFPLATLITPNIPEAAHLLGRPIHSLDEALKAARELEPLLSADGWVLLKGAHLEPNPEAPMSVDILVHQGKTTRYELPFLPTRNTHGTGCTLSSALAARLAMGESVREAVRLAKAYVHEAIWEAPTGLGKGHGPLRHKVQIPQ